MPSAATLASTAVAAEGPGLGADAIDHTLNTVRFGDAKPSGTPAAFDAAGSLRRVIKL